MMLRVIFIGLALLLVGFVYLQSINRQQPVEKPIFLQTDTLAEAHQTHITVQVQSVHKPSDTQLEALKADYANLWAHLNHLYATNDVEAGKEYYTEDWFRQICRYYRAVQPPLVTRTDSDHTLQIKNWSTDGLVCTAIDNDAELTYHYPNKASRTTCARIAVVMLYQGDHWRIDAMRVMQEFTIN